MVLNVTEKLIKDHLVSGEMIPGEEIALKIDQTLTPDGGGPMIMLELEAMGLDYAKTKSSALYVDHNLIQTDNKTADDHLFLESAAKRFGLYYSRPGNGISHPVHMQNLAKPGKTLLGSDSHTCGNGCMGMLAMGAGGLNVALAITGEPFSLKMPEVWGIELTGELPDWVSAKDVILELLRRHDVEGGVGKIIEYHGPGVATLTAMDRHVIANMGAELGATSTVFPSDKEIKKFLDKQGRVDDWIELIADEGATYDIDETINLSNVEPMIAKPTSPGNVVPVSEVAGTPIYQSYIGSSANPGFHDFAIAAEMVKGKKIADGLSFDINPTSRQMLTELVEEGHIGSFVQSGARLHQAGCNGCIGMGQAPATGQNSLRTTPRNFPGRSGVKEDSVYLSSPETAAASALTGVITDPRTFEGKPPVIKEPEKSSKEVDLFDAPLPYEEAKEVSLIKGPNIVSIPEIDELPNDLRLPILLKMGDDISTDEILAGGSRVLPFWSNLPETSKFTFEIVDPTYYQRGKDSVETGGHMIVGGSNYGQGSSRENAAHAPRYLGLRIALAKDFARIHLQNLINFGVLPLTFVKPEDHETLQQGEVLVVEDIHSKLKEGTNFELLVEGSNQVIEVKHNLSESQIDMVIHGGMINLIKERI